MCLVNGNSNLTTHVSYVFGPLSPFWFLLGLSPLARESRARASQHAALVSRFWSTLKTRSRARASEK